MTFAKFDYDLFVIGAGSGGVRAARRTAALGKKVAIAESRFLGGTCVNVGCVPKKLFVYAAEFAKTFQDAKDFGWRVKADFDWNILRDNKDREIKRLNGIYADMLQSSNIDVFHEYARLAGAHEIALASGKVITAEKILLATGGAPVRADFAGSESAWVSDDVFALPHLPKKLLVIGGGYIGIEFSCVFAALGVEVTQMLRTPESFLRGFDAETAQHLAGIITSSGKVTQIFAKPEALEKMPDDTLQMTCSDGTLWQGDAVLSATGRQANLSDVGLETVGLAPNAKSFLDVDENFRTSVNSIFALGDVIGTPALTPLAIRQAMVFTANQYDNQSLSIDYDSVPKAVFSLPPVGTAGLAEHQALARYKKIRIYRSQFRAMKYSLGTRDEKILMKMIVNDADERILGCHIVGPDAPEMIQLMGSIICNQLTKSAIDDTIALHPSAAEELVTLSGVPELKTAEL